MLQTMRNLAQTWVIKGLMLILMTAFSIWGIGDIFRGNPMGKPVAKVGDMQITVQDLTHQFEEALAMARQKFDPAMTPAQGKQLGLLDKALDNMIKRDLVDQDVKRLGIAVTPQAVLDVVASQPQLRNKDGSFNKDMFRQMLNQQGLNEASFVSQSQQDLARQIWLGALAGSRTVPQTMLDALYKARAQKRSFDVVTVDAAKLGGIPAPSDKELQDFYDQNHALFAVPEYRGVTVALLNTDALAKDVTITDEAVKKEYDDKHEQLAQPEKRDIVQVVVQDEGKAAALAKAAKALGDLDAAARASHENAIPMNELQSTSLMPELSQPIFAMQKGDISAPIKTQLGWHIIQLKNIEAAGTPGFDQIKEKLRADMRRDQTIEAATHTVNQLDDELAAGHALEDIADGLKLRLIRVPAIDNTGMTPDHKEVPELPNKAEVARDAFAQNSGEVSPVEDNKAGTYYVVRTDEITPAGTLPFDKAKDQIATAWKMRQQATKAQAEAAKIAKALQDGKAPDSFAGEEGVSIRMSNPVSQLGDTDPLLPQGLLVQALHLKKGETAQAADGSKQIVIRLASITDPDLLNEDPRKSILATEVKKNAGDELLDQYIQHLYKIFPVTTDAALLDHMRQQDN